MKAKAMVLNKSRKQQSMSSSLIKWAALVIVGAPSLASAAKAPPAPPAAKEAKNQFFDWQVNLTDSYIPSPFLTDQTANAVDAFLQKLPAGVPRAVKLEVPISNKTANQIFNNPKYNVSYVLGDLEMQNAADKTRRLAEQVRYIDGRNNGTKTRSFNAFIGNYGMVKLDNDATMPSQYRQGQKGKHSFSGYTRGDYEKAKLNVSMAEVYPGSGSFKNPAAGNSSAPNIRSSMFTLPALRVSQIEVNNSSKERNIPYIARFNNWGNLAMDTDRNAANGFKFETGKSMPARSGLPFVSASDTANQLLSRRDFATLTSHYRLRGADSYVAFESGVVGYNNEDKRKDAKLGWTQSNIDKLFKASDYKLLLGKDGSYNNNSKDPNDSIVIDGKEKSIESAGAIFSGAYSLSLRTLDVMLSNMDDEDHTLTLPSSIGGYALKKRSFDLDGGSHLLIEYKLTTSGVNKGWSVAMQQVPFAQLSNSRTGVGIPEPTTISLAAVAAAFLIGPRRRRAKQA